MTAPGLVLELFRVTVLFAFTTATEIIGCYLPWFVPRQGKPIWLLSPAAALLMLFAWLLTLHPAVAGRICVACGGVYIAVTLVWLYLVDGVSLVRWGIGGAAIMLTGMVVIAL